MPLNPFSYGNPVTNTHFIGRKRELRRILGRLLKGESTAIVGDPHVGKTSFLTHLASPEFIETLRENQPADGKPRHWHLSFIDPQMFSNRFTPAEFWQLALRPFEEQNGQNRLPPLVAEHYTICKENHFGNITLERFFLELKNANRHFILLIDEFDTLLNHPVLNNAEFYGGLRSLASRSAGAFAIVIASRTQLRKLNAQTQEFNPTGSPFFNIFMEIELGPLAKKDVADLLSVAGKRFVKNDRRIIRTLAGRHPYLLQAAAAAMWDAYEEEENNRHNRGPFVTRQLYRELDAFFADCWESWTPEDRKAFTAVGIAHHAHLFDSKFVTAKFIEDLGIYGPELSDLETKGIIVKDETQPCGWRVEPEIMLSWLADELLKITRNVDAEDPFDVWLQNWQIDGLLTVGNKKRLKNAANGLIEIIKEEKQSIIEGLFTLWG